MQTYAKESASDFDEDVHLTGKSLFDWASQDFSVGGVKDTLESQYGYIEDIETLRNAIEMERARRQTLENILLSGEDLSVHTDETRNECKGGVCSDDDSGNGMWNISSSRDESESGFLNFLLRTTLWHLRNFVWSGVNSIFMCISILISSSQLLTLVAHRDVLDSSSPEDVFHLLIGFVGIVSLITVLPLESLQNAISPVRDLLYFNSLLSLLSWHCFLEYDMDTNIGRFHLLTQMLISTTAVLTSASQTWLKWDFVIWIGCCLATLNHAAEQKWGDGSLSPWLWQIPGAYIAYAFPSDSVPSMVSTALAASQITYIGSLFVHELVEDLMEKEKTVGGGGGRNKRLSLRSQLRQSLANGATIVRRHGAHFRLNSYSSSSNTNQNSGSNAHLGKAAARRLDQQQAALARKRKKKEELRLRQLRKKERGDDERLKRVKEMMSEVVQKTNQIKQSSSSSHQERILDEAETMCSEFQEDVQRLRKSGESDSAMISNLRKHLKTLQSVVKHARNARRRKIQEECETVLRDALKDKTNRESMENAVNLAKRNGMTNLDSYVLCSALERC